MSGLREHAAAYLAMRRGLGYKLESHGRLLMDFIGYLEDRGHRTVTIDAATTWATEPSGATRWYWGQRLSVARSFARYLSAFDPACQVPPTGLLRCSASRPAPYLYTPQEIAALIHAAGTLASPLHAAAHQALISLLAVSGMFSRGPQPVARRCSDPLHTPFYNTPEPLRCSSSSLLRSLAREDAPRAQQPGRLVVGI